MILYFLVKRWTTKPCPRCGKRVKNGHEVCSVCGAKLRWEGKIVSMAE